MFKSISPEIRDIKVKNREHMDSMERVGLAMEPRSVEAVTMEPILEPIPIESMAIEPISMEPMSIEPIQPQPLPIEPTSLSNQSIKEKSLEDIKNQCSELISELDSDENPEAIVKKHIGKLKKYNELRDIALGLVTMIADQRKLRTTDILEEMKVELGED